MRYSTMTTPLSSKAVRILVVHNSYQQKGGEDSVVETEIELLRNHGHRVISYTRSNDDINSQNAFGTVVQTFWSNRTVNDFTKLVQEFRPDVVHVHNTFPLISPAIYWTASAHGIPVVQTLHNFRLICPQALLLRDGNVCEACVGHFPWRAARHACYRNSHTQSAVLATMVAAHRIAGTWDNKITRYIALNEFCRQRFIAGGIPADKILVKPNFLDVPNKAQEAKRSGILFVGRLSHEKGVRVLAEAFKNLTKSKTELRIAGTGPEVNIFRNIPGIIMLGAIDSCRVIEEMRSAAALVLPSIWYENFPRTIVEAFACGLPVIASNIGALRSLVRDGETGILFNPGDPAALAEKIEWAINNPEELRRIGKRARDHYLQELTGSVNYPQLVRIYDDAIRAKKAELR